MKNKKQTQTPRSGMINPQAIEAERAVIGAIVGYGEAYDEVQFLTPDMFYDDRHQALFEAVVELKKIDSPIDFITVGRQIAAMGKAEEISLAYIADLINHVATHAHIVEHALFVKEKYLQRQLIEFSSEVKTKAGTETEDIADVLTDAEKGIESLQEILFGKEEESSYYEISQMFYEDIRMRMARFDSRQQTGVNTGLTELNRITSGWQASELVILAARPAMGKTAVALHFAQAAARSGTPVMIFSLEMSKVSLYKRSILSEEEGISAGNLKSGDLAGDLINVDKAVARLCQLPIYVDDNANVDMAYIRTKARMMHKKDKCGMVIIDYLQLVKSEKSRYSTREQEISFISRDAKLLAKELGIPVILLSQLNRDIEKRQVKTPLLSDLRESGAIEQDADMVIFIHRPGYYGKNVADREGNKIENAGHLIIAKYRNGATGKVKFMHNDTMTRIFDL